MSLLKEKREQTNSKSIECHGQYLWSIFQLVNIVEELTVKTGKQKSLVVIYFLFFWDGFQVGQGCQSSGFSIGKDFFFFARRFRGIHLFFLQDDVEKEFPVFHRTTQGGFFFFIGRRKDFFHRTTQGFFFSQEDVGRISFFFQRMTQGRNLAFIY